MATVIDRGGNGKGKDEGEEAIRQIGTVLNTALAKGGNIMEKLLQASMVSPYMAVVSSWVLGDVLQKAHLIYGTTNVMIKGAGLAVFGLTVAEQGLDLVSDLAADITAITDFFGSKAAPPAVPDALISNQLNVLVLGADADLNKSSRCSRTSRRVSDAQQEETRQALESSNGGDNHVSPLNT